MTEAVTIAWANLGSVQNRGDAQITNLDGLKRWMGTGPSRGESSGQRLDSRCDCPCPSPGPRSAVLPTYRSIRPESLVASQTHIHALRSPMNDLNKGCLMSFRASGQSSDCRRLGEEARVTARPRGSGRLRDSGTVSSHSRPVDFFDVRQL